MKSKYIVKFALFTLVGAALGFSYYYFIGCHSGSCPITSNPFISTAYGGLFGVIMGWDSRLIKKNKSESSENGENND